MVHSRHLKRTNMPISWPVQRKLITFISRPKPGSFKRKYVISLTILLRDVLKLAKTTKEVKSIVNNKNVVINGKEITDNKYPCGMLDIIELPKINKKIFFLFDMFGKIKVYDAKDNNLYLKVSNKKLLPKKKYQINFMNGFNILVDEKTFNQVKVNSTIIYDYSTKKILKIMDLKEKIFVYIYDGKYKGNIGEVVSFINYSGVTRDIVQINIGNIEQSTAKDYCYVVGTEKKDLERFKN